MVYLYLRAFAGRSGTKRESCWWEREKVAYFCRSRTEKSVLCRDLVGTEKTDTEMQENIVIQSKIHITV